MGECEPRNFLQPCLLLLLRERSDHGYDLVNRLRVLHAVDGDAGAVYRALRGLEKAGMVRSSWQTSEAGPARRTYQVTPLGVATLDRKADILEETHRTLHLFRERYGRLTGQTGCGHATGAVRANGWPASEMPSNGGSASDHSGNGHSGDGVANNGTDRRRGDHGGAAGEAHGDPGGRGVRPSQPPRQRSGG